MEPHPSPRITRMHRRTCVLALLVSAAVLAGLSPGAAQTSFRIESFNTRRLVSGAVWQSGAWAAFCVDEINRDLNGDRDTDDAVLQVLNTRSLATQNTGIAIDPALIDGDEDWPVDISADQFVVQYAESDNGDKDMNGDGKAVDNVLALYSPVSKQLTALGIAGTMPTLIGGDLLFRRRELEARKDLNGDTDFGDNVLCRMNLGTREIESLGVDAEDGYVRLGDWVAVLTRESAQGSRDLNGDRDFADEVMALYQISTRKLTITGLDGSYGYELTSKLLAVGVEEERQGGRDLNGDMDAKDVVAHVWELATGQVTNLKLDCSGDLVAADAMVALVTNEDAQNKTDLNHDGDALDDIAQIWVIGSTKTLNLARDASGGIAVSMNRVALACSESAQNEKDLNGDRDMGDTVLMIYNRETNRVTNTQLAVESMEACPEGYLAWLVPEPDQGEKDLNRDGDADDSVLYAMDMGTQTTVSTSLAAGEVASITANAIFFTVSETDQGGRDQNGDGDPDGDILFLARYKK